MLTTPKDLSKEVVHILVLRLEAVSRFERTGFTQVRANEELGSRLSVGPAGRAFCGLDVCIQTTFQVPSHDEGIVVAHNRGTDRGFFVVKNADPRYLRGSFCERRGRSRRHNTNKRHCCQSSERQDRQSSFHDSYLLFSDPSWSSAPPTIDVLCKESITEEFTYCECPIRSIRLRRPYSRVSRPRRRR